MKFLKFILYFILICIYYSTTHRRYNVDSVLTNPYSFHATVQGDTIYVNGIIATVGNSIKVSGGIKEQTLQTLSNIEQILQQAPSSKEDILKINVYVSFDMNTDNLDILNEAFYEFFHQTSPSRTIIGINKLPLGAIIQIDCIAKISEKIQKKVSPDPSFLIDLENSDERKKERKSGFFN